MLRVASELGWPEAYCNDLYIDCRRVAEGTSGNLIWVVRDHGCRAYPTSCANQHELRDRREILRYWSGQHPLNWSEDAKCLARFYLVTHDGIQEVTSADASDRFTLGE